MGREEHLLESNHLHETHSDNIPFTAGRAAWEVPMRKFVRPNTDSAPKEEAREEEEEEARKRRKQGKKSRAGSSSSTHIYTAVECIA
jgi:cytosine/adenosine deaminase-related metal-dependent hydrolase